MKILLRWLRAATAVLPLTLVACGGGVYLDYWDDDPPDVSLAASSTSALAGGSVRLVAAAADRDGIDQVRFYRYDGSTAVRIGTDDRAPYEWDLLVPADGRTSVIVFARAIDDFGNYNDSNAVTISITP